MDIKCWKMSFKTNTEDRFLKTLAFSRLLGYFIMDGGIYKFRNSHESQIILGHLIDVNTVLDDLELMGIKGRMYMKKLLSSKLDDFYKI